MDLSIYCRGDLDTGCVVLLPCSPLQDFCILGVYVLGKITPEPYLKVHYGSTSASTATSEIRVQINFKCYDNWRHAQCHREQCYFICLLSWDVDVICDQEEILPTSHTKNTALQFVATEPLVSSLCEGHAFPGDLQSRHIVMRHHFPACLSPYLSLTSTFLCIDFNIDIENIFSCTIVVAEGD